jgi:two-component system response regulator HydG
MKNRVLVVDDDPSLIAVLGAELSKRGYAVVLSSSPEDALARIASRADEFDIILTDINMAGVSGMDLCARAVALDPDIPVVVMTAFGSMDSAVAAIRAGAYDYVTKPLDPDDLSMTLDRGLKEHALRQEVRRLRRGLEGVERFHEMVGSSPEMKKALELISRVAPTDTTILVTGESGSGKELVAKAIHARSTRANGPFVAINCAAMPESLLESELFGHTRGAYTDARQARRGLFVKASGGTLFLDEIGEMPLGMQAKLLRALQERMVRPVGGDSEVPFDTRIVAATNRDLDAEVAKRRFREDLFYRINVVRIDVPPLRARGRDVLILAKYMLLRCQPNGQRVFGFKPAVVEALLSYSWPGNVRELQNCIERAIALTEFDHIGVDDLPEKIRDFKKAVVRVDNIDPTELITVEELERRYIAQVLDAVSGNKTLAAKVLGFDRRTLYRKLELRQSEAVAVLPAPSDAPDLAARVPPAQRPPDLAARVPPVQSPPDLAARVPPVPSAPDLAVRVPPPSPNALAPSLENAVRLPIVPTEDGAASDFIGAGQAPRERVTPSARPSSTW